MRLELDQRDLELIVALLRKTPLETSIETYFKIMSQTRNMPQQQQETKGNNHDVPTQPATG